ncbi:nuclease PIN [Xanthomonas campestris]|uniref:argonaute/piwi family protein n=1 Tax=Xanthomonas campestris TaxID=339 RepID=UPI002B23A105|nr:nuclease PIN [Xanthomonas campestris]MEA9731871.1 nuclease PIN [Xanthomonas campestris]
MNAPGIEAKLSPFQLLEEPVLSFSPDDLRQADIHPLRGLAKFGPYSQKSFETFTPALRVAVVGPKSGWKKIVTLMKLLQQPQQPADRADYVPNYPGFERLFGIPLTSAAVSARVQWPDDVAEFPFKGSAEQRLAAAFRDALATLDGVRSEFDVVVVHLPESWGHFSRTDDFDAHDTLKSIGAQLGVPTQVVNDRAFAFAEKFAASIAWRLAIALYVKAGGTPWRLASLPGVPNDTAYIGLAYALKPSGDGMHYVTCCSQVFDMDGGGMQFVAFEARDPIPDVQTAKRNPFLSRADMRAVLSRSLQIYQSRNAGSLPRRLVIHKTTAFQEEEIQGAREALSSISEIECLEIGANSAWRGVWMTPNLQGPKRTKADGYPVPRGVVQVRSGNSCFVWVAGNAPGVSSKGAYYQGGKSIPRPLVITRHAGAGPLSVVALEALALTKMDWNNDALYDPVPVTIRYSQKLARTIANVPSLPGSSYPYRHFM